MYENNGHEVTINKEIFRTKIVNCFESYGIQHMNDEYKNAFTFPDGIKRMFQTLSRGYDKETILFSKFAIIIRNDIVKCKITFSGSLDKRGVHKISNNYVLHIHLFYEFMVQKRPSDRLIVDKLI